MLRLQRNDGDQGWERGTTRETIANPQRLSYPTDIALEEGTGLRAPGVVSLDGGTSLDMMQDYRAGRRLAVVRLTAINSTTYIPNLVPTTLINIDT